jgi:hypothetical protein
MTLILAKKDIDDYENLIDVYCTDLYKVLRDKSLTSNGELIDKKDFQYNDGIWTRNDLYIFYKSSEKKIIYVPTAKCAGTSITKCLTNQSSFFAFYDDRIEFFENNFDFYIKNYKGFIVVRDVKSAWISGLNEYMTRKNKIGIDQYLKKIPQKYIVDNLKKDKFIFDLHTCPQFSGISLDLIINGFSLSFIRFGNDLEEKISNFIEEDITLEKINSTENNSDKKENLNFCKEMFETYCENNPKFSELYKIDHELYNLSK